ncbi:MAG: type II toxin-antitoxin system RelE/ParE family toxin [Coriobacteriales bacterium]|jgi:phage-related protein|nr:type II toxin-antitoxin system RelE/ParE family toxin [Coriobacteriales bacterium]
MFELDFYTLDDGSKPVEVFLDSLDDKIRAKAVQELSLLEEQGNQLREPYSKHIEGGIFELRIKRSSNIAHVFYFFYVGRRIIATHGFVKKTQKTPCAEIERALRYKGDFVKRESAGNDRQVMKDE